MSDLSQRIKKCGERIKEQRERCGYSRQELCNIIKGTSYTERISYSTLERIEKGTYSSMPKLEYIRQLSDLFNVSEEYLLGDSDSILSGINGLNEDIALKQLRREKTLSSLYDLVGITFKMDNNDLYFSTNNTDYKYIPKETYAFFSQLIRQYAKNIFEEYNASGISYEDRNRNNKFYYPE